MKIFHIVDKKIWQAAKKDGEYAPETLKIDKEGKGGFIHCSRSDQILEVANKFFVGQKNLLILRINVEKVKSKIEDEAPYESPWCEISYPHIYGALNLDAVEAEIVFKPKADGTFQLPKVF
jgi:uncharacterized protein (DUF952 family)